jgi:guanylate kinase
VNRIEAKIKQIHPEIVALFIKPQTKKVWLERMKGRLE